MLLALLLLALVATVSAFTSALRLSSRQGLQMLGGFGFLKPANKSPAPQKVVIKVDGRTLESEDPVNLRKILQANKVDVYPLRGKLSNW
jgi:hypothetical protein